MYFVYILYSESADRYYIGSCSDIQAKLDRHNQGATRSTKPYRPWRVVYQQAYGSKTEALQQERYHKSMKSRTYLANLIAGGRSAG